MTDETVTLGNVDSFQDKVREGKEAERLLNNPILTRAFAMARKAALETMTACRPGSQEAADYHHFYLATLRAEQEIRSIIDTGKLTAEGMKKAREDTKDDRVERYWIDNG